MAIVNVGKLVLTDTRSGMDNVALCKAVFPDQQKRSGENYVQGQDGEVTLITTRDYGINYTAIVLTNTLMAECGASQDHGEC